MTDGGGSDLRLITVALDASPASVAGLRAAARLARRWGARVEAVCVADADIARLAGHPGAVALCSLTGRARPLALSAATIDTALSAQMRAARDAVDAARAIMDGPVGAEGTTHLLFRERRGGVLRELRATVTEHRPDLLVLGGTGRTRARWTRRGGGPQPLGSTARALAAEADGPRLLIVRRDLAEDATLLVPVDGSDSSLRALRTAAALVGPDARPGRLAVLLFGDSDSLRPTVAQALEEAGAAESARVQALPPLTLERLCRASHFPDALLVLSDQIPSTLGLSTVDVIDRLSVSVLLLR